MIIKTDEPIIVNREKITRKIAEFWDQISEGWRMVWGEHIHHGYYESNQSLTPKEAQEKLLDKITDLINLSPHPSILDVGCGMGGSSFYLAKKYSADVTGITLSQKQVDIATKQAEKLNIKTVKFKVEDALSLESIPDNSVDVVWSLESCEQFFDKKLFIKQAFRVLKPGGKLMLATWCSNRNEYTGKLAKQYQKLCFAFDVPYMPTIEHYYRLLTEEGFSVKISSDWSMFVRKSWNVGLSLMNAYSFWKILKVSGIRGLLFAKRIKLMRDAFWQNRIQYGVFLAIKPVANLVS